MKDDAAPKPTPAQLFRSVFPSIMLPMFLAVVDQTIVATALPAIAASLGGVERVSWVVVAYLVAGTIAAPVYGQLRDVYGGRRMMWMRSATSNTWGMLWLIKMIGRPQRFTSSISSRTLRDALTPSAAVGSSMIMTRLPKAVARTNGNALALTTRQCFSRLPDVLNCQEPECVELVTRLFLLGPCRDLRAVEPMGTGHPCCGLLFPLTRKPVQPSYDLPGRTVRGRCRQHPCRTITGRFLRLAASASISARSRR